MISVQIIMARVKSGLLGEKFRLVLKVQTASACVVFVWLRVRALCLYGSE